MRVRSTDAVGGVSVELVDESGAPVAVVSAFLRHLATLGRAIAADGRVPKTIHLLDYCNDPVYRHAILGQINRGEGRHELARRVCHGNKGETPPALPARPRRTARSARPRRQLHRSLQHHLYPAGARPARGRGIRGPPRRHPAPNAARIRAHHAHRPLPPHPRRPDPPRRVPAPGDPDLADLASA